MLFDDYQMYLGFGSNNRDCHSNLLRGSIRFPNLMQSTMLNKRTRSSLMLFHIFLMQDWQTVLINSDSEIISRFHLHSVLFHFQVVIIAFTSFWLGLSFLGDRINIGMICLLTILTQFRQSRSHVPPTSIITFLDFWMILCIIMVVVQLLQTTLVYYLYNREKDLIVIRAEAEEKRKRKEQSFFSQQVPYEIRKVVESNDHEYRRRRRVIITCCIILM